MTESKRDEAILHGTKKNMTRRSIGRCREVAPRLIQRGPFNKILSVWGSAVSEVSGMWMRRSSSGHDNISIDLLRLNETLKIAVCQLQR